MAGFFMPGAGTRAARRRPPAPVDKRSGAPQNRSAEFTDDEIRDMMKYKPLTDEQKEELEERRESEKESKLPNNGGQLGATSDGKTIYPTTPESSNQQPTDGAQSKINDALGYES